MPGWIGDHVLAGAVVVPGTVFVEAVLHVAGRLGCEVLEELVIESPLVLSEGEVVQLQLSVEAPDEHGRRRVTIYARAQDTDAAEEDARAWTRHASGVLAGGQPAAPEEEEVERGWPRSPAARGRRPGAIPVEVDDLYGEMAELGFEYGPAFACVRGAWRRGEELFCEAALGESEQAQAGRLWGAPSIVGCRAAGHGGAMHGGRRGRGEDRKGLRLPFAFNGVRLRSRAPPRCVWSRSRGADAMSMVAFDEHGALVASVRSLSSRPRLRAGSLRARRGVARSLFGMDWVELAGLRAARSTGRLGCWVRGLASVRRRFGVRRGCGASRGFRCRCAQVIE